MAAETLETDRRRAQDFHDFFTKPFFFQAPARTHERVAMAMGYGLWLTQSREGPRFLIRRALKV
ncbi:hypothetical protein CCACVL1_27615 [Corchorus capsularis]|uniref:Uncharacterized protein n=1 Tax=Corchorus capsularis TaxID=210143 RepID=A0A1R3G9K5_COCAP|nr:hypothetical protein CCACVL1_27615 [Corchorus capsularis]